MKFSPCKMLSLNCNCQLPCGFLHRCEKKKIERKMHYMHKLKQKVYSQEKICLLESQIFNWKSLALSSCNFPLRPRGKSRFWTWMFECMSNLHLCFVLGTPWGLCHVHGCSCGREFASQVLHNGDAASAGSWTCPALPFQLQGLWVSHNCLCLPQNVYQIIFDCLLPCKRWASGFTFVCLESSQ